MKFEWGLTLNVIMLVSFLISNIHILISVRNLKTPKIKTKNQESRILESPTQKANKYIQTPYFIAV